MTLCEHPQSKKRFWKMLLRNGPRAISGRLDQLNQMEIKIIRVSQFPLVNYRDITGEPAKANTDGDKLLWRDGNFHNLIFKRHRGVSRVLHSSQIVKDPNRWPVYDKSHRLFHTTRAGRINFKKLIWSSLNKWIINSGLSCYALTWNK